MVLILKGVGIFVCGILDLLIPPTHNKPSFAIELPSLNKLDRRSRLVRNVDHMKYLGNMTDSRLLHLIVLSSLFPCSV